MTSLPVQSFDHRFFQCRNNVDGKITISALDDGGDQQFSVVA